MIVVGPDETHPAEVTYGVNGSTPLRAGLTLSEDGYITGKVDNSVEAKQYGIVFTATNTARTDNSAVKMDIAQAPTIATSKTEYETIIDAKFKALD